MSEATPPGPGRVWVELLPEPWDNDPEVVVVMVPTGARIQIRESEDTEFLAMLCDNELYGLQILSPSLKTYPEHNLRFRSMGGNMAHPAHFGKLSHLPQRMLVSDDFKPIVFNKEDMSQQYLDLGKAGKRLAQLSGESN
jgi:hypothetical protein